MKRLLVPVICLGFLVGSSVSAQPQADKKIQALEKSLSAKQQRLLNDYLGLQMREDIHYFNPGAGVPLRTPAEIRKDTLDNIVGMSPEKAKVFWRDLPYRIKRGFRSLDPLFISAEERKAASALPEAAKQEVAKLLSEKIDEVLAARQKVIACGPACRALVVDQVSRLPENSPKRLRHLDLLSTLSCEEAHDRCMRVTEAALQKATKLKKARQKASSTIAILVSRELCGWFGDRDNPYRNLCYYNFLHSNHEYKAGVGLEYGNGPGNLGVNFYGGQDSRLKCLGAVKYAEVKKAPGSDTTAKWWKEGRQAPTAAVGDVYLLHLVDRRDGVDFAVKFRIVDMSAEEWIIIEWERIEQDN